MSTTAVRLFDRDGFVYAHAPDFGLMGTGATDEEALRSLKEFLILHLMAKSLGLRIIPSAGTPPAISLASDDRHATLDLPSAADLEANEGLRAALQKLTGRPRGLP